MKRRIGIAVLGCLGLVASSALAAEPAQPASRPEETEMLRREIQGLKAALREKRQAPAPPSPPAPPPPPEPPIKLPQVFRMHTARLLPAAALYSSSGLDTSGGLSSSGSVGLGDVAEFGLEVNDFIRAGQLEYDPTNPEMVKLRECEACGTHRIYPNALALFKVGVGERRLWSWQPAVALGFRKSFEKDDDRAGTIYTTRVAELFLVLSKSLGKHVDVHAGASFWDASIVNTADGNRTTNLHDDGLGKQLRAFGGIEVEPLEHSQIMVELLWVPQLNYGPQLAMPSPGRTFENDQITLKPILSWGVRYQVADWMYLESGVRVPDIGNANLLNSQIFGQVKFVSRALSHLIHGDGQAQQ